MALYGAIEGGGTKFVCAAATGPEDIRSEVTIPTETPEKTLSRVAEFFKRVEKEACQKLKAVGIGCFGPLDLDRTSPTYGSITTTPKKGWLNTDVAGFFGKQLGCPVGFDTDVNAAALGETVWGAGKGLEVVLYLTVGTGIGGGLCIHGKPQHGLLHPEMGHVFVCQDKSKDPFECCCPYHDHCLEGLASGRAVDLRWKRHASELEDDHPAWDLEADYLAQGLISYILTVSPQRIILGGGLMHKKLLYPLIQKKVRRQLNGYVSAKAILKEIDRYIVAPGLQTRSGICGALALAMEAAEPGT